MLARIPHVAIHLQRGLGLGLGLSLFGASSAHARGINLQGRITDAVSGEGLPLATAQVMEQFTGIIANEDGFFTLEVSELPVTLRVTYIGYTSGEHVIADSSATQQIEFRLSVTPHPLPEMVVRPDEARHIMAEVIRRKAQWRPRVQSWRSEAYTRMTMMKEGDIFAVLESVSEVHWKRDAGYREVVLSQRRTENLDDLDEGYGALSAVE
jgi:hypothetical protein